MAQHYPWVNFRIAFRYLMNERLLLGASAMMVCCLFVTNPDGRAFRLYLHDNGVELSRATSAEEKELARLIRAADPDGWCSAYQSRNYGLFSIHAAEWTDRKHTFIGIAGQFVER